MKKLILLLFILLLTGIVSAEKNKMLLLGFESEIIAYNNIVYGEGGAADKYNTVTFLLGAPKMGLNIGFLLGQSNILGVNLGFGYAHAKKYEDGWGNNGKYDEISFKFMPYYEYLFNTSAVRPFLKIGFIVNLVKEGDYDVVDELTWMIGGMVEVGTHFFIGDSFSIDLGALFQLIGGKDTYEHSNPNIMSTERNQRIVTVAFFFGLTGWI